MSKVQLVDSVVMYDCVFSLKSYLLVMHNALYIPIMRQNMIPPFIMREAGLVVSDNPKIHCDEPTVEDHSIYNEYTKLGILLKLDGIFLYFPTRDLTQEEIERCD